MSFSKSDLSPESLIVWRLLRDEGGYWTACEVAARLIPDGVPSLASARSGRWLAALARRGHVAVNPSAIRVMSYGVTPRCVVPSGESLDIPRAPDHDLGGLAA